MGLYQENFSIELEIQKRVSKLVPSQTIQTVSNELWVYQPKAGSRLCKASIVITISGL